MCASWLVQLVVDDAESGVCELLVDLFGAAIDATTDAAALDQVVDIQLCAGRRGRRSAGDDNLFESCTDQSTIVKIKMKTKNEKEHSQTTTTSLIA